MQTLRRDAIKFIIVMIVFLAGMIAMMIYKIEDEWIWIGYIIIWTYAEMKIAKNFHLKWWGWALILAGIFLIDLVVIHYFG